MDSDSGSVPDDLLDDGVCGAIDTQRLAVFSDHLVFGSTAKGTVDHWRRTFPGSSMPTEGEVYNARYV